jgi:hypothetical protein
MTIKTALATPIPIQLVSGCTRCIRMMAELMVMTAARRKRRVPASLDARAVLRARRGTNCRSTTNANKSSIRLSVPKAKIMELRASPRELSKLRLKAYIDNGSPPNINSNRWGATGIMA